MTTELEVDTMRDYLGNEPAASRLPYCIFHPPQRDMHNTGHGKFSRIDQELAWFYHPGRPRKR